MRRDEQLDDMERTISRIRMDNDALREEVKCWKAERDGLKDNFEKVHHWLKHLLPLCEDVGGQDVVESELIKQAREYLNAEEPRKL
jgi:hypothetical protein